MAYTVDGLESSRNSGFRPRGTFGILLKDFLGLFEEQKILDLGCGTGFFTRILAEQSGADITGVDINETLLAGAKDIAAEQNLNIRYEIGDITDLRFDDNSFDIVMCDIMLECFRDITIPLQEMVRVCKPGGLVVAIEPFYQSGFEYYPEVDISTRDLLLKFSRADRAFGVGPRLPQLFNEVSLTDIDMIGWFWGKIGYKTLDYETVEEKLLFMKENLITIKKHVPLSKCLNTDEQKAVINFYEERLKRFSHDPSALKTDMSVSGLPVFIVKGFKRQATS